MQDNHQSVLQAMRQNANVKGLSGLSVWINFGHISAQRVILSAKAFGAFGEEGNDKNKTRR